MTDHKLVNNDAQIRSTRFTNLEYFHITIFSKWRRWIPEPGVPERGALEPGVPEPSFHSFRR